jgi:hypothetical protein
MNGIIRGQVFVVNSFIFQYSNKSLLLLASSILKNHMIARCPDVIITIKVKVKRSRYRPSVAQRVGRGIALLFHDHGTRRG